MATLHGKNAIVYLQGSGAAAITLTEAADWTLDVDFATDQDNSYGDTWETHLQGLRNYKGTVAGNFDTAQSIIFDAITAVSTPRNLYLYPDRATSARYYYGTVWPKLSQTMPMATAKFSMAFIGDGVLALN